MSGIHAERMVRALRRLGWEVDRTTKHFILTDGFGHVVSVPMHKGRTLGPGLARAILKSIGVSEDLFFRVY